MKSRTADKEDRKIIKHACRRIQKQTNMLNLAITTVRE